MVFQSNVRSITNALQGYISGRDDDLGVILTGLTNLAALYPRHIEKEDKNFFFPVMDYFSSKEQDEMLMKFFEFDRKMIHEKYQNIMEALGGKVKRW